MYFGTALVDASGRIQDRRAAAVLGRQRGDSLAMTVVGSSAVIARRRDGVFTMTAKPYVALPAPVRARCAITAGARVLVVADAGQDALVVHSSGAVGSMLAQFHHQLARGERP
ncbi:hypothetical protein HFP15_03610 [Amycolatopsis sp. K13G38]|uniref:Roadblock/LC7 domain-containing protein n=1 Tax=Amycolatopsis acididurans TaxID=2724524 RepID=A0ABX1J0U7_9PSEU|nr:hypothetical protein [Amycolatopsis acididurans]